jgi:ABC-2 type transport system permease protein
MRILDLAIKDLLQIIRDWKAAFFMVIMPVLFTLVFGFAFGGNTESDGSTDTRIPVGYIDHDQSTISQSFYDLTEITGGIRLEPIDKKTSYEDLEQMVIDAEIPGVIIIPQGYSQAHINNEELQITTILQPGTAEGAELQSNIQTLVTRLEQSIETAKFSTLTYEKLDYFSNESARLDYFNASLELALLSWESPPLAFKNLTPMPEAENTVAETTNAFTHASPGMMVQFALAGLIGAAEVLVLERKSGALRRLLTTDISRKEILIGHFLAMCIMIFIQLGLLIGFAQLFLQVPYFSAPMATILVTLATTLFAASLGLLIGTLAKTPDQVVMFSLIPMFIFSGLGGAWMPLEFTSETFQTIGHFTPLAWAMDGYQNIIIRGLGVEASLMPSAVLIGFAGLCLFLSIWRFRFE